MTLASFVPEDQEAKPDDNQRYAHAAGSDAESAALWRAAERR